MSRQAPPSSAFLEYRDREIVRSCRGRASYRHHRSGCRRIPPRRPQRGPPAAASRAPRQRASEGCEPDPRLGPVSVHEGLQPLPAEAVALRPSAQRLQPYPFQDTDEASQEAGAHRDGIVSEPPVADAFKAFAGWGNHPSTLQTDSVSPGQVLLRSKCFIISRTISLNLFLISSKSCPLYVKWKFRAPIEKVQ